MDNQFKLSEKTVVLHGPINSVVQSLANQLTELGADIALVTDDEKRAQVFSANLNDLREVHRHRGRASGIHGSKNSLKECNDIFARAAESFGSIDVFIDANSTPLFVDQAKPELLEKSLKEQSKMYEQTLMMTSIAEQYLSSRTKGRMIFVTFEATQTGLAKNLMNAAFRGSLKDYVKNLAMDHLEKQLTANVVVCGVTEEYLTAKYKGKTFADSKKEFAAVIPNIRPTEAMEVASAVAFLSSSMSSAINGQTIYATHGF